MRIELTTNAVQMSLKIDYAVTLRNLHINELVVMVIIYEKSKLACCHDCVSFSFCLIRATINEDSTLLTSGHLEAYIFTKL